jgi:hypothetical protein
MSMDGARTVTSGLSIPQAESSPIPPRRSSTAEPDRLRKCPAEVVQKLAGASEPVHGSGTTVLRPWVAVIASWRKAAVRGRTDWLAS